MKYNPLISIIIPVYNMEEYLEECMISVQNQTYKNLDIVLVDDGSKDRSPEMCDNYALKDSRVRVIHKKNGGLISAWIAGVEQAKGQYLVFVDSDDWIELNMVEKLSQHLIGQVPEIICSDYVIEKKEKSISVRQSLKPGIYEREYIEKNLYDQLLGNEIRRIHASRCMKLISRELVVNNIKFCNPEITMGEDLNIMFPAFLDAERIVIVEDGFYYHYRLVDESMAHKYNSKLYVKVNILYKTIQNIIYNKFTKDRRQEIFLNALKKEYIFLLFLVLKNELRGPGKGCAKRIREIVREAKIQEKLGNVQVEVNSKANKLLYFIWKYPGKISVLLGRCAIGIFDRL